MLYEVKGHSVNEAVMEAVHGWGQMACQSNYFSLGYCLFCHCQLSGFVRLNRSSKEFYCYGNDGVCADMVMIAYVQSLSAV